MKFYEELILYPLYAVFIVGCVWLVTLMFKSMMK